jgi:putative phosphoesterase
MALIAIFSDSHDNLPTLRKALSLANSAGATALIHCGDLCAPFVVNELAGSFSGPIHIVFGNNDADGRLLQVQASRQRHVTLHGIYAEVTLEGRTFAVIHYPEPALRIAESGRLDVVCYGHNHRKLIEQVGDTWLVNPGELLGMVDEPTFALYDSVAHSVRHVAVE